MNMKALLGAVLALVLAVGGAAFLVTNFAKPPTVAAPPEVEPAEPTGPHDPNHFYRHNPFAVTVAGPKSKVVVDETRLEFGTMALGASKSHDFVFKNTGDGPMRLAKGPMMCKCTMPAVPNQEIPPGESIKIKLTWTPVEATRDFSKEAEIWTNDPENPKIVLAIRGTVSNDPLVSPEAFHVGEISWNNEKDNEIQLMSTVYADLKIVSVKPSHPDWMTVTWEPVDVANLHQPDPTESKPLVGYALKLKIVPDKSVGPFSGWVTVKTNVKEDDIKVEVSGIRSGPITMHGADYHAALALVDLKRFKSAEGKETSLFMYIEPFAEDLQITEVISESKNLTATLTKKPRSSGAKKDFYVLAIQAKKGVTPGTVFSTEKVDHLTLKTNHPTVPALQFNVRYIVH